MYRQLLAILFTCICFTSSVFAAGELYINQYPINSKEGEVVQYTLKSELYNLNDLQVTWKVDGKSQDSGVGRTTFSYTTPKQGKQVIVSADVAVSESDIQSSAVSLRATPYFILFEGADSYVPAFYKGRALPGKEGIARIGLISLDRAATVNWQIEEGVVRENNKRVILIKNKIPNNQITAKALIYTAGTLNTVVDRTIPLKKSEAVIYRTTKLQSYLHEVAGGERGEEFYLLVEPYYFSTPARSNSALTYTWGMNGENKNIKNPWLVRIGSKTPENIDLSISVKNQSKITQSSSKSFTLSTE
jgi:hypothetical protein